MPKPLAKTDVNCVLGFDFGMTKIGVAVGQRITMNASPLGLLKAQDGAPQWGQVETLIQEWAPQLLLVGYPVHMDGSEQFVTKAAKRFGNRLSGRFQLPVEWVDERLTSYEAEHYLSDLLQGDIGSHRESDKLNVDSLSAKLIIEQWFNENPKSNESHRLSENLK